ncbi:recombinase family protein [Streptomyces sp. NPDC050636]|uniref:recombinase family protein n=1 Tax=Streptomyces sp. NPDC050636 TaxID=3154510 RepID=UPI0034497611
MVAVEGTLRLTDHHRVESAVCVREMGGPSTRPTRPHDLIMSVFGGMSKGERNRIKARVHAAMAAQTEIEGRYLGGRPPYGYRLVDLGPHPNPAKAADGKRLRGLGVDPETAPVVQRVFAEFLRGLGIFAIAKGLTRDGIPSPSAHDPARNRHRDTRAWSKSAVLTNPRCTGRQVWNRQRKDDTLLNIEDVTLGYTTVQRWNAQDKWIVSKTLAHTPLIDDDTFAQAQDILTSRTRTGPAHGVKRTRSIYLREKHVLPPLDAWLSKLFAPHRIDDTTDALASALPAPPDTNARAARAPRHHRRVQRQARHPPRRTRSRRRPATVTKWMAQTQGVRAQAEADLNQALTAHGNHTSRDEIAALVRSYSNLAAVLHDADRADRAATYKDLGLVLTYHPGKQKVLVEMNLNQHSATTRGLPVGVRGGT